MFCHKCGNQIDETAAFCYKCGAKVDVNSIMPQSTTTNNKVNLSGIAEASKQPASITPPEKKERPIQNTNKAHFKRFVDSHVRKTTNFQTAEELLTKGKPFPFAFMQFYCMFMVAIAAIMMAINPSNDSLWTAILLLAFLGTIISYFSGAAVRNKYRKKFYGEFEGDIDFENFKSFLQQYLKYISPDFHDCGYFTQAGVVATIENIISASINETSICCEFGPKKKRLAIIWLRPDASKSRMQYGVHAVPNGFMLDGRAAGLLGHACLIKIAPILQAAMEYYLQHYKSNSEKYLSHASEIIENTEEKEVNNQANSSSIESGASSKRKSIKLPLIIGTAVVTVITILFVISSCFNDDKYVQMIKDSTLTGYPQKTVGQAFDSYLDNPQWESGSSTDGIRYVNVTGELLYKGEKSDILVQFIVDDDEEQFFYQACELNGIPQSDLVYWTLLESIYGDDFKQSENVEDNAIDDEILAGQLIFDNTPIEYIINLTEGSIIDIYGEPDAYSQDFGTMEYGLGSQDRMCFYFSGKFVTGVSANPEKFSFNGQSLAQDFDAIVSILGDSYVNQGNSKFTWGATWYYNGNEITITFFNEDNSVMDISVFSVT